jgi:hypothetical protein
LIPDPISSTSPHTDKIRLRSLPNDIENLVLPLLPRHGCPEDDTLGIAISAHEQLMASVSRSAWIYMKHSAAATPQLIQDAKTRKSCLKDNYYAIAKGDASLQPPNTHHHSYEGIFSLVSPSLGNMTLEWRISHPSIVHWRSILSLASYVVSTLLCHS